MSYENPYLPQPEMRRCLDLVVRHAFGMARVVADSAGLYHVILIGAGATAMLPFVYWSRAQAREAARGMDLLARHADTVRLSVDKASGTLCARVKAGVKASEDEIDSILGSVSMLARAARSAR